MVGDSVPEALTTSLRNTVVPSLKHMIAKDTLEGHLHTIIQSANEVVLEKITIFVCYSLMIWL